MNNFTESILETLSLGIKITLSNGISLHSNLNNDIIYEYRGDRKSISEEEVDDILNSIKFWKTEKGRYVDMNFMTTSHIENSIKHQEKKLLKPINRIYREYAEKSINDLQAILRERNINEILENENFGLDNIT